MIKKLLCALALGALAVSAQAATQTFDWSFSGFDNMRTGAFDAAKSVSGRFVVDDVNADGRFAATELRAFLFMGTDFVKCTPAPGEQCEVTGFSYAPGKQPNFHTRLGYSDADTAQLRGVISIDGQVGVFEHMRMLDWWTETQFQSNQQTRFSIAEVSAVPEPQTYLMFGVGMLALAGIARRRAAR
ncbi:PEP-CTERM sorting domain-containing protein [Massilia sp. P8910]|uniref:PEP-CTERM sorting domain-containing protein n=1 Tax=Massilia antarctica TaxID=2765360 RepID=UPI001E648092|nr:PEP-CTERM sorting domain-containing protein [Massilia antarctica]